MAIFASMIAGAAPLLTQQPDNLIVVDGGSAEFAVSATGNGALTYQWEASIDGGTSWNSVVNDATTAGADASTLSLSAIPLTFNERRFRVRVTDGDGTTVSDPAGLQVDHTELWGMGSNFYGQLGTGAFGYHPTPMQIGTGYQTVIARGSSSLFLKPDGTLWASGLNTAGSTLHDGTTINRVTPVQIASGVTAVSSIDTHTLFLKADHTLWGVGGNGSGQLGIGNQVDQPTPVQIATGVAQFSAGSGYSLYVKTDGTMWGMGGQTNGVLGVGASSGYQITPIQIDSGVESVVAGSYHSLFIKTDGTLWGMGRNNYGQLGAPAGNNITYRSQIATHVTSAAVGRYHTLFLKTDGTLWSMGQNNFGQLGDGATTDHSTPTQVASGVDFVTASWYSSYYVKSDKTLWAMGRNDSGQLGDGTLDDRSSAVHVADDVAYATASSTHLLFQKIDGSTWAVGRDEFGEFGIGKTSNARQPIFVASSVTAFSAGYHHSLFVKSDGSLWAVGDNTRGELGDGSVENRASPVHVMNNVAQVEAGYDYSLVLKADGTLLGMGTNDRGQLGLGAGVTQMTTPVQIATDVSKVVSGYYHSLFIKQNGTLWGMGLNSSGQLGDGTTTNRDTPFQIDVDVATATSGSSFTLISQTNGALKAAGRNSYGVFGNGSSDSSVTAAFTEVSSSPSMLALSAGTGHSLFLHSDHTLWTSGSNTYGQLGRGDISAGESVPAQVATDVAAIDAGGSSSFFLKTDGSLWGMGFDLYAPFSPESVLYTDTPTQFETGVHAISANTNHILFLKRGAPVAPAVLDQSGNLNRAYGEPVTMEVSISGFPTPTLQWKKNGTDIPDENSARLKISYPTPADAGSYVLVVSNSLGTVQSDPIILTVDGAIPPTITTQPVGAYKVTGESFALNVAAAGTAPLSYQWKKDGAILAGKTAASLVLSDLQLENSGSYSVTVSNPGGSVSSSAAILQVENLPQVTSASPNRIIGNVGQALSLSVTATSAYAPLTYRWKRNNRPITGATAASYTLPNFTNADAGAYTLEITDAHGYTTRHTSFVLPHYGQTQVIAWGGESNQTPESSVDISDAIAVASNYHGAYILRGDGTVLARDALTGNLSPVSELTDIVAMSAGSNLGLFLRADGSVIQVGWDGSSSELDVHDVIAVARGETYGIVLKSDGTVQTFDGLYALPEGLDNVVAIATGSYYYLALKADGAVVAWGSNNYGETSVPVNPENVIGITAAGSISAALRNDGTVAGWGNPFGGVVDALPSLSSVASLSLSSLYAVAVKTDGTLVPVAMEPADGFGPMPGNLFPVVAVSAGYKPILAIRDSSGDAAPTIGTQPDSSRVHTHDDLTLSVTAAGVGPFYYQWRKDGTELPSGISSTLQLTNISTQDAGAYDVVVTTHAGSVTSEVATVAVIPLPEVEVASQVRQGLEPGAPLDLQVNATGTGTLHYQWYRNGRAIIGETGDRYQVNATTAADSGYYWIVVTDDNGSRQGTTIFVRVSPPVTQIRGWGRNSDGQISVPAGLNDAVAVSAGGDGAIALRRNGTVVTWGYNTGNQPTGWNDIVATAAGSGGCYLGLRANGTLVEYGDNTLPAGLTGVVAIRAYQNKRAVLKDDGSIVVWKNGQMSVHDILGGVMDFSLDWNGVFALRDDGTVLVWDDTNSSGPVTLAGLNDVVQLSTNAAIRADGTVVYIDAATGTFSPDSAIADASKVSYAFNHALVLHSDGSVIGTGANTYGESNVPADLGRTIAVSAGSQFSLALVDYTEATVPQFVQQPADLTVLETQPATFSAAVSGGTPLSYQWRKDGAPISGGTAPTYTIDQTTLGDAGSYDLVVTNALGTNTSEAATLTVTPIPVITLSTSPRQVVAPGNAIHFAATATGTGALTYQWYHNGRAISGATALAYDISSATPDNDGYYYMDATDQNGTRRSKPSFVTIIPAKTEVIGWGDDSNGQASGAPTGGADFISLKNDTFSSLGLRRDGTVVGWGYDYSLITPPEGLSDVVVISMASTYALALKADGTVVAWGSNRYGVLPLPDSLKDVVSISANSSSAVAVKTDGSIVTWGEKALSVPSDLPPASRATGRYVFLNDGRVATLGEGNHDENAPYLIYADLKDIIDYANVSLLLFNDGRIAASGYPDIFGLTLLPPGLNNIKALTTGLRLGMALTDDGSVIGWGKFADPSSTPAIEGRLVAIAAGSHTALALRDATSPTFPYISRQPADASVSVGTPISLDVRAVGTPAPAYQWRKNGGPISGATDASFVVSASATTDAGEYDVLVSNSAGSVSSKVATVTVSKINQDITFATLSDRSYSSTPITLEATSFSGLPVTFAVVSGPATISGNQLTLTGSGTVTVRASQAGDASYLAADPVDRSFTVTGNALSWNAEHFTEAELGDSNISGPTADPDGDGLTNLLEYALGLDPRSTDTTGLPEMSTTEADWVYTYTRPINRTDITYEVEMSTDLSAWTTSGVTLTKVSTTGSTETWRATVPLSSAANVFLHLKVTQD